MHEFIPITFSSMDVTLKSVASGSVYATSILNSKPSWLIKTRLSWSSFSEVSCSCVFSEAI